MNMTIEQQQCYLGGLGFYTLRRRDGSLAIDGIPGPATEAAIRAAQERAGVPASGIWDSQTEKAVCKMIAGGATPSGHPPEPPKWEGDFWDDPEIKPYFKREEFMCPHHDNWCGGFPVEPAEDLVRACAHLRKRAVEKIPTTCFRISSGVRCQAHNDELPGSVPDSRHVRGRAVDFSLPGISPQETYEMAMDTPGIVYAYIMSSGWVHMDIGN